MVGIETRIIRGMGKRKKNNNKSIPLLANYKNNSNRINSGKKENIPREKEGKIGRKGEKKVLKNEQLWSQLQRVFKSDSSIGCIAGPPLRDLRCLKKLANFREAKDTSPVRLLALFNDQSHSIIILRPSLVRSHLHGCTSNVPRPSIEEVLWLFWEANSFSHLLVGISDHLSDRLTGWLKV